MKIEPVKIAVVGCGVISDTYLENLTRHFTLTEVVGCNDLVVEKQNRQAEKYRIKSMSMEEILSDPSIAIVVNLTYMPSHYAVSKAALEAGKHVYCEKVMAASMAEAGELCALAREKQRAFVVAPDTFLGASMQTCRYIVDKGLIGTPIHGIVQLARSYQLIKTDADEAWRQYTVMLRDSGAPYDMAGYYLHALFNMFGSVRRVCGFCDTFNADRPYLHPANSRFGEMFHVETENTLCGVLEFRCGFRVAMTLTSDAGVSDQTFRIIGTEGTLECGDPNNFGDPVFLQRAHGEKAPFPFTHPYSESRRGIGVADMAWALRTGRPPRIPTEMGLHTLEIIKALAESCQTGRMIELNTTFERPVPIGTGWYKNGAEEYCLARYADILKGVV